mmetsp:Transcript_1409/g.3154  ORF Transcript_1409/g.3154 Transcript_1409/m.3154 type:complete len:305 (-) Transcript_1409:325-1239(-)
MDARWVNFDDGHAIKVRQGLGQVLARTREVEVRGDESVASVAVPHPARKSAWPVCQISFPQDLRVDSLLEPSVELEEGFGELCLCAVLLAKRDGAVGHADVNRLAELNCSRQPLAQLLTHLRHVQLLLHLVHAQDPLRIDETASLVSEEGVHLLRFSVTDEEGRPPPLHGIGESLWDSRHVNGNRPIGRLLVGLGRRHRHYLLQAQLFSRRIYNGLYVDCQRKGRRLLCHELPRLDCAKAFHSLQAPLGHKVGSLHLEDLLAEAGRIQQRAPRVFPRVILIADELEHHASWQLLLFVGALSKCN